MTELPMGRKRERFFAGPVNSFPVGEMREVPLDTGDLSINALVANVKGTIVATTSKCTHYGMPLAKGVLTADGRVYCPFHGACFRMTTGDIEDSPGLDPLKKIEVEIAGDDIYLLVDPIKLRIPTDPIRENKPKSSPHTVFVGAGATTLNAVQEMRRHGYEGSITVVTAEPHATIDRTKLSKGTVPELSKILIRDEAYWHDRLGVDLRTSCYAYAVDIETQRVLIRGDDLIPYDNLVLATGSLSRRLPIEGAKLHGVYTLRSLHDAQQISAAIERRPRQDIVIIGTGFIGLEMAVAFANRANVTLLGQTHVPLEGPLGRQVGAGLQTAMANDRPLRFLNAVDVVRIEAGLQGNVAGVVVQPRAKRSAEVYLPADVVLMSTGAMPATQFLKNSSTFPALRPDGSLEVDSALRVVGTKNVYAGGDIASYPTAHGLTRIEHWNVASNHGREIGRSLASGRPRIYSHIPVFWSGMGSALRYVGHGAGFNAMHVDGEPDEEEFVAYYAKDDRIIAVATMNCDPVMAQSLALMRSGLMPKLSEIVSGTDILSISLQPSSQM
ncbi:Apoptosis-inducing factor 1 [Malassezia psittaci]|uniref:Apoptosis-inducing factor 1 n=1 Tax=Malassezia psittaci TaxID=1821823 RepID=A0AAF0F9F2_9BASI|nr:Apoptosis-inducing factor 1 [Malassezia psittaci]